MHQWTFKNHNNEIPVNSKDIDRDICFMDGVTEIIKQKGLNGWSKQEVKAPVPSKVKVYNIVTNEFTDYNEANKTLSEVRKVYPEAKIKTTTKTVFK